MAEALGQAATQAPQPMQAAASIARSAFSFGTGIALASWAPAGVHRDEAAGLDDAVERAAVDHEVLEHRERLGAPGLDQISSPSLKLRMCSWQCRGAALGPCGTPLIISAAHAADALAAVVVEGDRLLALLDQALVEHVEHLEERHVGSLMPSSVGLEVRPPVRVLLAPDVEGEVHL
jgi:hypothetical protein